MELPANTFTVVGAVGSALGTIVTCTWYFAKQTAKSNEVLERITERLERMDRLKVSKSEFSGWLLDLKEKNNQLKVPKLISEDINRDEL